MTSNEYIAKYDAHQRLRGFSANTAKRRNWTLTNIVIESSRGLDEITVDDIETFLGARSTPATRRALLGDLRMFYRWANQRGHLEHDPTRLIDVPKVPSRLPTPLSTDELRTAITTAGDTRLRLIILLGAYAGLRVSEIAHLRHDDVTQPTHLTVRQGKGGKDRIVPLHPDLAAALGTGDGHVIGTRPANVSQLIRQHFRRCRIDHRPHDLRHTFGTEAANVANGDLRIVAALMGHASVRTTERYVAYRDDGGDVIAALFAS